MAACTECGANLALVGKAHRCRPRSLAPFIEAVVQHLDTFEDPKLIPAGQFAIDTIDDILASPNLSPNSAYMRNLKWRMNNRPRYNEGQKGLMRKRRANEKAND